MTASAKNSHLQNIVTAPEKQRHDIVADAPYLKYFINAQEHSYLERELEAAQALNVETFAEWFSVAKEVQFIRSWRHT